MAAQVAVVTGGSRGVGRGIALTLGQHAMAVYVTGRGQSDAGRARLLEAAEAITAAGGCGIAVPCDHADDAQVAALFQRVRDEHGRLDILINNATNLPRSLTRPGPFWRKPTDLAGLLEVGLRSHYIATHAAAPLLVETGGGLVVMTSSYGARCYMHGPAYGAGKAGVDKMAMDMAVDLRPFDVAAVSLWLGFVRTEKNEPLFAHPDAASSPYAPFLKNHETPGFIGQIIAALHRDPERMARSGRVHIAAELAAAYGITEPDGRSPRSSRDHLGAPPEPSAVVVG